MKCLELWLAHDKHSKMLALLLPFMNFPLVTTFSIVLFGINSASSFPNIKEAL